MRDRRHRAKCVSQRSLTPPHKTRVEPALLGVVPAAIPGDFSGGQTRNRWAKASICNAAQQAAPTGDAYLTNETGPDVTDVDGVARDIGRLRRVYAERSVSSAVRRKTSLLNPGHAYNTEQRRLIEVELLLKAFPQGLRDVMALDLGCAGGGQLRELMALGLKPDNFWGIDLMPDRVEAATSAFPDAHFLAGSAHALPMEDASVELVTQFMLMSSILSPELSRLVVAEVDRVLKPGGHFLWYDCWTNPLNTEAKGIGLRTLRRMFPHYRMDVRKITLAPPLARLVGPKSMQLVHLLNRIPILRTHYLVLLTKPAQAAAGSGTT